MFIILFFPLCLLTTIPLTSAGGVSAILLQCLTLLLLYMFVKGFIIDISGVEKELLVHQVAPN